jgi:DNA-binding NtrC family response regulator
VTATNTDLAEAIARGRFLQDLYDRLAFEVVRIPPLREREGDIEILAHHFLDEFLREVPALGTKGISPAALAVLKRHTFPGNVRELKNTIERAAYRDRTNQIDPEDIDIAAPAVAEGGTFDERVEAFKRRQIVDALAAAGGNQTRAAQALGLSYDQFRHYYRSYGLGSRRDGAVPKG